MTRLSETFRNHVILQYTVTTFVVILLVTLVLAQLMSRHVADDVIKSHLKVFPELVRTTLKQWLATGAGERRADRRYHVRI